MLEHLRMMARYNQWANARLCKAVAALDEADYMAERGAFFGSIHGTMNHILVVDRLWRGRVEGKPYVVDGLDQIVAASRDQVLSERAAEDEILIAFTDSFDTPRLDTMLTYATMNGIKGTDRCRNVLAHMFNHATHHRGQVHGLLSQVPCDPPSLDLIPFLRETGA